MFVFHTCLPHTGEILAHLCTSLRCINCSLLSRHVSDCEVIMHANILNLMTGSCIRCAANEKWCYWVYCRVTLLFFIVWLSRWYSLVENLARNQRKETILLHFSKYDWLSSELNLKINFWNIIKIYLIKIIETYHLSVDPKNYH